MKKVLLGLVIAVMMTGSGYSREISSEKCDYLLLSADGHIHGAMNSYRSIDQQEVMEKNITLANKYAETWSALCD